MAFSKLTSPLRITAERTIRVPLDLPRYGDGVPTLLCRFAGDGNDAFKNAEFKAARQLASSPDSAARERVDRELDAPIFAEHVVVGWEDIFEDDPTSPHGVKAVAFSVEKCKELLLALASDAPDQFNRVRVLTRNPSLFRDAVASGEDLGKG